jgi:multicomponent Na+:H+ antiporter subunit G
MAQNLALGIMLAGAVFMFLAAVGLVRMPDLFTRMHANTKSATLGIGLLMVGTALFFENVTTTTRALAIMIFLFVTVPVGAHLIGRAAYFAGVPLWEGTLSDELRGLYDVETHELIGEGD